MLSFARVIYLFCARDGTLHVGPDLNDTVGRQLSSGSMDGMVEGGMPAEDITCSTGLVKIG